MQMELDPVGPHLRRVEGAVLLRRWEALHHGVVFVSRSLHVL